MGIAWTIDGTHGGKEYAEIDGVSYTLEKDILGYRFVVCMDDEEPKRAVILNGDGLGFQSPDEAWEKLEMLLFCDDDDGEDDDNDDNVGDSEDGVCGGHGACDDRSADDACSVRGDGSADGEADADSDGDADSDSSADGEACDAGGTENAAGASDSNGSCR